MDLKFTIPLEPRTKKNSPEVIKVPTKNGKEYYRVLPSKAYRAYEKACKGLIPKYKINEPINVKATYYMGSHRKVDLCNLHEALHDVMVAYGCVLDDDSTIIVSTDGSRVLYDKKNPRTEVHITGISPEGLI